MVSFLKQVLLILLTLLYQKFKCHIFGQFIRFIFYGAQLELAELARKTVDWQYLYDKWKKKLDKRHLFVNELGLQKEKRLTMGSHFRRKMKSAVSWMEV